MDQPDEKQMAVSALLDVISRRAARMMQDEREAEHGGSMPTGACACMGNGPGDPVCYCAMKWVQKVGSCWYRVGSDGPEYLCRVGYRVVYRVPAIAP